MTPQALHAAQAALSLVNTPREDQSRILRLVETRLDRPGAIRRRDEALRQAFSLIGAAPGSVRVLAGALAQFAANEWPCWRHLAEPPDHASPLRRHLFHACQAAADAGAELPGERQIRRIVF